MENKKQIAVLLTCHNRKEKTLHCLRNLFLCEIPLGYSFEVYLVDDGSTDGTSLAVKVEFPLINIIQGDGQLYWNRGMHLAWNSALKKLNYDFYLWLNDDSFVFNNAITELFNCSLAVSDYSIVCGFLCSEHDSTQVTYGGKNIDGSVLSSNGKMQSIQLINGNVVLIPKAVYERLGMLDPIFPHAIGDYDYGLRAVNINIPIYSTTTIIGTCESNPQLPIWCLSKTPLLNRLKHLYSPLGNAHPYYFFIYEKRHFGILIAIKHFISIHIRVLFPKLWKK